MTIVATTIVHPNPGVAWGEQLKRASELASKHGAENVAVLVTIVGGQGTNAIGLLTTAQDWATYGKIQQSRLVNAKVWAKCGHGQRFGSTASGGK
jgi:hypothetical protein